MTLKMNGLENIVGKGVNTCNQHFLLFSIRFSSLSKREIVLSAILPLSSANSYNLVMSKILSFAKDLCISHLSQKFLFNSFVNPLPHNATF